MFVVVKVVIWCTNLAQVSSWYNVNMTCAQILPLIALSVLFKQPNMTKTNYCKQEGHYKPTAFAQDLNHPEFQVAKAHWTNRCIKILHTLACNAFGHHQCGLVAGR